MWATLAFAGVAATVGTTVGVTRAGLPPMASLNTRGVSWSGQPTDSMRTKLPSPRPLGGGNARMARLGDSDVAPQVPLPKGDSSQNLQGAGIYQPDWDEIDLGDDFLGSNGMDEGRIETKRPYRAPYRAQRKPELKPELGAYEEDGSIPWMRRMMPGHEGDGMARDENAKDSFEEDEVASMGQKEKPRDADSFDGAFPRGAPRLHPTDLSEPSERSWDFVPEDEPSYDTLNAGASYEDEMLGELESSYAAADAARKERRFRISREQAYRKKKAQWEAFHETYPDAGTEIKEVAGLGASREAVGAAKSVGAKAKSDKRHSKRAEGDKSTGLLDYTYDYGYDYGLITLPRPLDYDYENDYAYDYGYDYDYGKGKGKSGKKVAESDTSKLGDRDLQASLGIPGLTQHIQYAGDGATLGGDGTYSPSSTRILLNVKPNEWNLAYMQLASLKRVAPKILSHVTVLTHDTATRDACVSLGNAKDKGVDCFLDENFVTKYGDVSDGDLKHESGQSDYSSYENALSWRKLRAAYALLTESNTPVVLLDADIVWLNDPTSSWREAMNSYDITVNSFVGSTDEAQRNSDTKIVLLPAGVKTKQIVKAWLKGERVEVNVEEDTDRKTRSPERVYFNYVLVPTSAAHVKIHAFSAHQFSNFLTAHKGADGAFGDVTAVTGGFCENTKAKELFLKSTLTEKAKAEQMLQKEGGLGDRVQGHSRVSLGVSSNQDFESSEESSGQWALKKAKSAARRASRIVERKKERAEKRNKGLPLISSVDSETHAAAVGVAGGDVGLIGDADSNSNWPPVDVACDIEKRRQTFRGDFRVTEDRRVEWTS